MVQPFEGIETLSQRSLIATGAALERLAVLTLISHPDGQRVGDEAWLPGLKSGQAVGISRLEPIFAAPRGRAQGWPLADPSLSRKPAVLTAAGEGIRLVVAADGLKVAVGGVPFVGERVFSAAELALGVPLLLGRDVVVLLHTAEPVLERPADLGLVGESEAIQRLRADILRVAEAPVPVLIRGETGTGKELAAAAIHRHSPRAHKPWVAVSMAALAPSTALSSLFGHVRGAFTGAVADHEGWFANAHGGSLFLDEIGEASIEVQTMLLRVLETSTFVPLGGRAPRTVDVRLIAATDAELEDLVVAGRFRSALQHRLEGYRLRLPALRERRADLGRLLYAFLAEELARFGEANRLVAEPGRSAWLPGELAIKLLLHPWPGNVRELRNTARQLAIGSRGSPVARGDDLFVEARVSAAETPPEAPVSTRRRPADIGEAELLAALEANTWRVGPTARALGLPRSSLYMLIDRCAGIRKANEVPEAEVQAALATFGSDLDRAAGALKVSPRGLRLRLGRHPEGE
jgi:two-component system nitrogen regulation response regulator GlnG